MSSNLFEESSEKDMVAGRYSSSSIDLLVIMKDVLMYKKIKHAGALLIVVVLVDLAVVVSSSWVGGVQVISKAKKNEKLAIDIITRSIRLWYYSYPRSHPRELFLVTEDVNAMDTADTHARMLVEMTINAIVRTALACQRPRASQVCPSPYWQQWPKLY